MAAAANRIVENRGGITVMVNGQVLGEVTLSIAGIMSDDSLDDGEQRSGGCQGRGLRFGVSRGIDPFMTLSFMALPVIPSLRITTRGVFDVSQSALYLTSSSSPYVYPPGAFGSGGYHIFP